MRIHRAAMLLLGLAMTLGLAHAEQKVEFRGHELHYIVLNSTNLSPEIASQYGLQRSGRMALINLSVLEQQPDGVATPVEADVSVRVRNLIGQAQDVDLEVVREQNAIYHLGQVRIDDREMLWFDVTVDLPDEPVFEYSFSQEMWEEGE
ncbi:DUF4426 domain-containing protein [Saccharospirillum salsuginis]|uniref:DUF4426 domain-containing protein n=1 Tax=Saccharospirillum salsuginis TaxID=418750 RepID=A0A918K1E3_9GAMM|nr:DUF4426 domain-containing protein [Saccharospirillum salsuginis]GGX42945.1 hypothetical protein GCM10007392_06990 [Saccharospirillum salsuginis]